VLHRTGVHYTGVCKSHSPCAAMVRCNTRAWPMDVSTCSCMSVARLCRPMKRLLRRQRSWKSSKDQVWVTACFTTPLRCQSAPDGVRLHVQ